jgi:hypothetical protein
MATFTALGTFSVPSLFPLNATVTQQATETVDLSSQFQYVYVSGSSKTTIYGPTPATNAPAVVYFFASALSTNENALTLEITGSNTSGSSLITLDPGDWAYFPFRASASGCTIKVVNSVATASVLNIFYGEKA